MKKLLFVLAFIMCSSMSAMAYITNASGYIVAYVDGTTTNEDFTLLQLWESWADGDPLTRGDAGYKAEVKHYANVGPCLVALWSQNPTAAKHPQISPAPGWEHKGFWIEGARCNGLNFYEDYTTVSNMVVVTTGDGIYVYSSAEYWIADGNLIHANGSGQYGLVQSAVVNAVLTDIKWRNNVVTGPFSEGMRVYVVNDFFTSPRADVDMHHNTVYKSTTYGIRYVEHPAGPGTPKAEGDVSNNTVTDSGTQDYIFKNIYGGALNGTITGSHNASSDTSSRNVSVVGAITNVVSVDEFLDCAIYDLRLRPGSQYHGAGTYLASVPIDCIGDVRANPPTIGAFELTGMLRQMYITQHAKREEDYDYM